MYFITTKRMLEVCFSVHPNIQYRTEYFYLIEFPDICVLQQKNCLCIHVFYLSFLSTC